MIKKIISNIKILLFLLLIIDFLNANINNNIYNIEIYNNKNYDDFIFHKLIKQFPTVSLDIDKNIFRKEIEKCNKLKLPIQKWFFDKTTNSLIYYIYVPNKIKAYLNTIDKPLYIPIKKSYIFYNTNKIEGEDVFQLPLNVKAKNIKIVIYREGLSSSYNNPLFITNIKIKNILKYARTQNMDIPTAVRFFSNQINNLIKNNIKTTINPNLFKEAAFKKYLNIKDIKCINKKKIKNELQQKPWENQEEFKKRITKVKNQIYKCNLAKKEFYTFFIRELNKNKQKAQNKIKETIDYVLKAKQLDGIVLYLLNKYIGKLKIKNIKRDLKNATYTFLKIVSEKKYNNVYFINSYFKIYDPTGFYFKLLTTKKYNYISIPKLEKIVFDNKLFNKKVKNSNFFNDAFIFSLLENKLNLFFYPIIGMINGKLELTMIFEYKLRKKFNFYFSYKRKLNAIGSMCFPYYFIPKKFFTVYSTKNLNNSYKYIIELNNNLINKYKTSFLIVEQTHKETVLNKSRALKYTLLEKSFNDKKMPKIRIKIKKIENNALYPKIDSIKEKLTIEYPKWFLSYSDSKNVGYGYDKDLNKAILKAKENYLIQSSNIINIKGHLKLQIIKGNFVDYEVMKNQIRIDSLKTKNKFKITKKEFKNGYWFIEIKSF